MAGGCRSRRGPRLCLRLALEGPLCLPLLGRNHGLPRPGLHRSRHGRTLYSALLGQLRADGMRTAIGGIALPNPASVALHERLGFRNVARFREVGFKQDRWIDVGYWQLMLHGS